MISKENSAVFFGRYWHRVEDGKIQCDLCPRYCQVKDGQRGFCFVRKNIGGRMALTTYGRSSGFCIDPIEKKPLNHFYPGTSVLSFGTAGCNLGCRFCQNWDISKSRETERLSDSASPMQIARTAEEYGCRSVAFTYNDPVIFAEYAIDIAAACRERGICTVAVTAGYITEEARPEFFAAMDAANVDLKAFSENFYHKLCAGHLQPVLDTLKYLVLETDVWVEITTLLIPGANDSEGEIRSLCEWIATELCVDIPLHFTAFHPDFRMTDYPPTSSKTLSWARKIALEAGLQYVYTGNVVDRAGGSTYCPACGKLLIERDWYELGAYNLDGNACRFCGHAVAGRFDEKPGEWGRRRQPIRIGGTM